jgi:homoserine kinase
MKELKEKGSYTLNETEKAFLSDFVGNFTDEMQTIKTIGDAFNELNYLIDPHTAVAYDCYKKVGDKSVQTLIVSTASPYKFPFTVAKALGLNENKSEFELIGDIAFFTKTTIPFGISKLKHSIKPTILKTKEEISKIVKYEDLKVEVKVPCSSANLGSAFDSTGIAFSIYNSFIFESNESDEMVGFKGSSENNLVYKAYKKVFEVTGRDYVPCKITLNKCGILASKGLGSSSSCIVAGVLGANYMLKNLLSEDELLSIMVEMEGHPDNVAPAYLGGLVSSCIANDGSVVYSKIKPNRKLKMFALIPNFETNTKKSRENLPSEYSRADVTNNVSRVALLQSAFINGDVSKIKVIFEDKIHEPYRYPFIKGGLELKAMLENLGYAVAISGAGPSLLAIGLEGGLVYKLPKEIGGVKWKVKELKCDDIGAKVIAYNF